MRPKGGASTFDIILIAVLCEQYFDGTYSKKVK